MVKASDVTLFTTYSNSTQLNKIHIFVYKNYVDSTFAYKLTNVPSKQCHERQNKK